MPESRSRKKAAYTPPVGSGAKAATVPNRWAAPAMVTCFVLGLAWIVLFYLVGTSIPGMSELGNWNILIGMGLIVVGFGFATQWK
jgi:hypothetical protein